MIRIMYLVDKAVDQGDGARPSRMVTDDHPTGVSFAMGGPFLIVNARDDQGNNVALAAYHGDRVIKIDIDVPGKKNPINLLPERLEGESEEEYLVRKAEIEAAADGDKPSVPASGVGRPKRRKAKA